ncbi:C-c chemokine receptor type 1 [Plakobranchus ocellatus]|uniref:C-c chemokine receptor type 1 n=1 Tax=Plakobranchus ocellatus TaxID=259542 RepID=A0AAV4A512_9GAST|nr:C-c chemokine receptor type 1 [Plakobranchus ocellatus]
MNNSHLPDPYRTNVMDDVFGSGSSSGSNSRDIVDSISFSSGSDSGSSSTKYDNCMYEVAILRALNLSADYVKNLSSRCVNDNGWGQDGHPPHHMVSVSLTFYSYVTPIVLAVGLGGNLLSLIVFLSRNMRKLSASKYLAALSVSDICALIFYVLTDWLRRGLPNYPGSIQSYFLEEEGTCQVLTYLGYVSRFISAWIIVTFTMERYIGVCHPLRRKDICGSKSAQKVIVSLLVIAFIILSYKPLLTSRQEYKLQNRTMTRCTPDPAHAFLSYVLDSSFALSITLVPFTIISVLNSLIIRRLQRRKIRNFARCIVTEESVIRMEFTVILLVVSFVFIALNLPYFIVWSKRFLQAFYGTADSEADSDSFDQSGAELLITRVIFYLNYCVNFFLYSVTGAYFRKELKMLFWYRQHNTYNTCSRASHPSNTPQSFV